MNTVKLSVDYLKTANYALFHNRMPVCRSLEITNESEQALTDVKITCAGDYIRKYDSSVIASINPGETIRVERFEISPDAQKLAELTERVVTDFTLTVTAAGEPVLEERYEIELMPYDHWLGTDILPQTLVSFITPNHPAISDLLVKTAAELKKITGSSVITAYQKGNVNDVRAQVAALFAALHSLGIIYRSVPASYEEVGQRITMPERVLSSKIGNCIELTLLMATALEAMSINSVIVFRKGHAYLGVWLVDDCYSCSVCDDASFIEKKCSRGINEMLVIECTQITQENTSFETAVQMAERDLADHSRFEMFVDVKRARLERILPLPARVENDGTWTFETNGVEHDACIVDVQEHDRYDLSHLNDNIQRQLTKYDIWERKLLDFSLRNSLLNLNLRRKAIQFISFDVNRIEDHLQDGKEYCITSKPNIDFSIDTSERLVRSKLYPELRELISTDINRQHLLHSYLTEAETKNVLKNIYRAARNAIEETGANSLFLTIGTLRWFESEHSEVPRYAPLLLLPVEMVYKKGNYYIRTTDEEITLNITLLEFLRQNFDISFKGLDPLPTDESGVDVNLIFTLIRDALKNQKRWDVEEECLLGTFSFSKFLMWNDIHSHRDMLGGNPIVNSLVENRLTWTPEAFADNLKDIDEKVSPTETAIPVAVDSSQMAAVIEGGKGHSFILYGPPGTGKSQTITNLIANALYQGKRVLFVAEKMAALSVVQARLAKIGLDPFCLELHSNKTTKRHVLGQLEKALKVAHIMSPEEFNSLAEKIFNERKTLIAYMNALHNTDKADGLSLYECIVRYLTIEAEPLANFRFEPGVDQILLSDGCKGLENMFGARVETIVKLVGQPSKHPLAGLMIDSETVMNPQKLTDDMAAARADLMQASEKTDELRHTKELRDQILRNNKEDIFSEDPADLNNSWREACSKWFIPRFFAKRNFLKRLRQFNPYIIEGEVTSVIDSLSVYKKQHEALERVRKVMTQYFDQEIAEDTLPDSAQIKQAIDKLAEWPEQTARLRDWLHWCEYAKELEAKGLGCVADAMTNGDIDASEVGNAYLKALYRHKIEDKLSKSPVLATFEGMIFDDKVEAYRKMTDEFQLLTQKELYARLASRVPRVTEGINSSSEIGLLNRNISNGGRGLSLRDLFDQIPTLLPRLCPCMLMSPMSVAQYIRLGSEDMFDLVIFDEASQMPTSEAVGAIARGKALIVVGDPKQMPPTSFFSSTNVDAEEASIDDMESILEDCRTLEIPSLQLSWHYRSRHESLIAFSNNEYYEGSLITFPSVDDSSTKVHHVAVEGFYDKGGKRNNRAEAEAIVEEVVRRLRDPELRKQSIGIISFSVVQQALIEDLLQDRLDGDKELQDAATQMYEPIFVKNLENVQGDERDVILFSIGYGPNKDGKVSMNFGPLNNAGGERRLNVAVSRARQEMYIFSTLKSSDIDLSRSKALGVEGLKHFLRYAETQTLPSTSATRTQRSDTLIAEQIAEELRALGYRVDTNIGRSRFKVDVAVGDPATPDRYRLGILLDGEGYRDTHTTRDREVVQPSVLTGLNWQIMRVWSVDWYNNPDRVIERIVEKLNSEPEKEQETKPRKFDISTEKLAEHKGDNACEYVCCEISGRQASALRDDELMREIIAVEQPITFIQLCRRVCAIRGVSRVTATLQKTLSPHQKLFYRDSTGALWLDASASRDYKSYRPNSGRDITEIPMIEIKNAICDTLAEQLAMDEDSLMLVASKKFGFTRRGTNVDSAFRTALELLKSEGKITTAAGRIRLS
ncbi:MAG: DUF4011 domain-containing protein [Muribaculaceae bacterium]|nr:DUF4011 domain-containing protein [Muribaculaceae bacterium]